MHANSIKFKFTPGVVVVDVVVVVMLVENVDDSSVDLAWEARVLEFVSLDAVTALAAAVVDVSDFDSDC